MKLFCRPFVAIDNQREFFSFGVDKGINVNGEMMTTILLSISLSTEKKAKTKEVRDSRAQMVWLRVERVERILVDSKENTD